MRNFRLPPSHELLSKFDVNRKGLKEAIWSPLYDFATYPIAGLSSVSMFSAPIGQGVTSVVGGSGVKTLDDTNMDSAGAIPAGQMFIATDVQVVFIPGSPAAVVQGTTAGNNWNDVQAVYNSGYLKFFIGSKDYIRDAPLGAFPPEFRLAGSAALSDTSLASAVAGATQVSTIDYATAAGMPYEIAPVKLIANQNFNVSLNWAAKVVLPSNNAGRIGVRLGGWLFRLSQ